MPTAAIRRAVAIAPRVPLASLTGTTVILGFGGLLLQDQVPPLLVYCLQLFLAA